MNVAIKEVVILLLVKDSQIRERNRSFKSIKKIVIVLIPKAYGKCKKIVKQEQHIETNFVRMTNQSKLDYRLQLASSIKCGRFLLHHGFLFCGHDESKNSDNARLFIDFLRFLAVNNEEISKVRLDNVRGILNLTSPPIQKDIVKAIANETTNLILKEFGARLFYVHIDKDRDVSIKEQMEVVLRFVDKKGCVVACFLSIKKVASTKTKSLKKVLDDLFSKHSLSVSMFRGQGYNGAGNMQREYNGLKALIFQENECAHYIHWFGHQFQLALVAVAKNHPLVNGLFYLISDIVNTVGGSCKKQDMLREVQVNRIIGDLANREIISERGLNQESTITYLGDTHWGSHCRTYVSLIELFGPFVGVLDEITEDGLSSDQKYVSSFLLNSIQSFDFVFSLHMLISILRITNDLSQELQRKDQDIENAIRLVDISKKRTQKLRDDGWNSLVEQVSNFCKKNCIFVPNMDDGYVITRKSKRRAKNMINFHPYHVELFNTVIDMQIHKLNYRFIDSNTELFLCVAFLNPHDFFSSFDVEIFIRLAKFYPKNFSRIDLLFLSNQLENFIMDIRSNIDFVNIRGVSDVSRLMVESRREVAYPLVYKLLTLALILAVVTATVEQAFSGIKIVKSRLCKMTC